MIILPEVRVGRRLHPRPPRAKADATKRDQRTRSNRPKVASASGLMQHSERSSGKKQEVTPILSKEADAKVNLIIVDKDCHPKDSSEQPNPVAIEFKNELSRDELNASASRMSESHNEQHGAFDSEKEALSKVPLSDPICCFTSDDEEMTHAPTRKYKRPFGEINLDLKAEEHESLEDQKRRNSGPSQPQNLHTLQMMQGRDQEPSWDAARFKASVDTDPTKDSNVKEKVCQNTKENESKQLLAAQQIALC